MSGDPRPSIGERSSSHEAYVEAVTRVCTARARLMLQENAVRFVEAARRENRLDPAMPLCPLVQVLVAPVG